MLEKYSNSYNNGLNTWANALDGLNLDFICHLGIHTCSRAQIPPQLYLYVVCEAFVRIMHMKIQRQTPSSCGQGIAIYSTFKHNINYWDILLTQASGYGKADRSVF